MAKLKLTVGNCSMDTEATNCMPAGSVFDVFPDSFMQNYTKHLNFTDFCQAIGCNMTSQDDLNKLDNGDFDSPIKAQSEFESWEDMVETAYQHQIRKN
ncbi:MAG: hypothetical protein Q4E86_07615 [Lachnospiraceae bacterium]|nr:hypothetical protein [Lachnospiraceae bacterium]